MGLTLEASFPPEYPEKEPIVKIIDLDGITQTQQKEIETKLAELVKKK